MIAACVMIHFPQRTTIVTPFTYFLRTIPIGVASRLDRAHAATDPASTRWVSDDPKSELPP
jgi:hypothetical protein